MRAAILWPLCFLGPWAFVAFFWWLGKQPEVELWHVIASITVVLAILGHLFDRRRLERSSKP